MLQIGSFDMLYLILQVYGLRLTDMNQPLLLVQGKKKRRCRIPPEICHLTGESLRCDAEILGDSHLTGELLRCDAEILG